MEEVDNRSYDQLVYNKIGRHAGGVAALLGEKDGSGVPIF